MMTREENQDQMARSEKHPRLIPQRQRRSLNPAAVERLLQHGEALQRAHPGLVFEDAAETLRQIREERMKGQE
jgi:hypothetical protein